MYLAACEPMLTRRHCQLRLVTTAYFNLFKLIIIILWHRALGHPIGLVSLFISERINPLYIG
jgi:hypothetical protein